LGCQPMANTKLGLQPVLTGDAEATATMVNSYRFCYNSQQLKPLPL
jgi:hypothetical protein